LSAFDSVLLGAEDANQRSELQTLQAKIDALEKTIRTQQEHITSTEKALSDVKKQLDEQIKENKKLRLLCEKAGIDTAGKAPESFSPDRPIVYRGQERTKEWLEKMYKMFHDKIACVDSNYIDIGEGILDSHDLQGIWVTDPRSEKRRMGVAPYGSTILSVLGNGEVFINHKEWYENILHIRGVEHNFVDGEPWPNGTPLIRNGTFNYIAANGQHRTVWSFVVYKPLTREQFAEAISGGFELVNYVKQGEKIIKRPIR
jgi:regulator of replication initiation timing